MNRRVRAVLRKELAEYRRNKLIVLTAGILPVVFIVLPMLGVIALPATARGPVVDAVLDQTVLFFLLIPAILPTTIAAYAVIGEREQATLEPILATPVSDRELLLGKALAATAPGVALTYILLGVFVLAVQLFAAEPIAAMVVTGSRIVPVAVLAPLVAVFAIEESMAISVRSSDIRVAQQLAALALLPVIGALSLFTYGVIQPGPVTYAVGGGLLLALDVAGWRLVTRMFDRERLLTRYGG